MDITTWFTLGTAGMVLGTAALAYGLRLLPDEKQRPFALVVAVPAIAAFAYAIMAAGYGALTAADGAVVFLPRYVDWLLTTPIHVAFVGLLVGASTRQIARVAALQALTIALGFAGGMAPSPVSWALYLLGCAAFAGVVYAFYTSFEDLAASRSPGIEALFRKLRAFVVVLWLVYPVIWVLAPAGIGTMDAETTALVVTYIDVVAKAGFGLIALSAYLNMAALGEIDVDGEVGVDADGTAD